ncbi:MAG TPA: DUF4136 domain-containing protein [Thermoanaerobaculia bacterium]|nr:DUF4136 domain-containing protein [Thermoanaerobaculia bacterium]
MTEKGIPALILAATFAAACASSLNTKVRSDPRADFSRYKTFQLQPAGLQTDNQAWVDQQVASRLEAKGLKPVDQSPNLRVVVHLIRGPQDPQGETGYGWWTGGAASAQATSGTPVGTLAVDLIDPSNNQLVWRGEAAGTVPPTGGLQKDKVQFALDRIFADFPPKPASK